MIEPRYKTDVEEAFDADEDEDEIPFDLIHEQDRHSEPHSLRKYRKPVTDNSDYSSSRWSRSRSESSGSSAIDIQPIAFSTDPRLGKYGSQGSSWSR